MNAETLGVQVWIFTALAILTTVALMLELARISATVSLIKVCAWLGAMLCWLGLVVVFMFRDAWAVLYVLFAAISGFNAFNVYRDFRQSQKMRADQAPASSDKAAI